ncbi:MAG: hypothetical protein O7B81_14810, partial [Gammaproteobacteria bacterium]|nr:hypothetical protein [Gammaproteobacteria bacterium]
MIDAIRINRRVFVLTFAILALELALIRWTSGQVRTFAYFGNLVLIVVFLGLGIGTALGRNGKRRLSWAFPCITFLAAILAFAPQLGITHMHFPDPSVAIWGGTIREYTLWETVRNLAVFVSLIALVTTIFVCIGTELGWLFSKAGEKSIDAYAADLAGSLAGVLCFAALTLANATPPIWLLLGMAPLVVLRPGPVNLGLGLATVVLGFASIQGALYSPYNRIDVSEHESGFATYVKVNRDFHQIIWDFDDA